MSLTKKCRVCGDSAFGFNFNVVTCESCKSFFRRHALQFQFIQCINGQFSCKIDKQNRRYCKRCRLEKCFSSGMQKEILFSRIDGFYKENGLFQESCSQNSFRISMQVYPNSTEFRCAEQLHMLQLRNASANFQEENALQVVGEAISLIHIANLAAFTVRNTIKFCKHFPVFKKLSESDQLILLKSFYPEKGLVRVAFSYDIEKDGFLMVHSKENSKYTSIFAKLSLLCQLESHQSIYERFKCFITLLHLQMENDSTIRDLILAQLLFQPRGNLTCLELIRYNQIKFNYLLKRYLEHKYASFSVAHTKYVQLTELIWQIESIGTTLRAGYLTIRALPSNPLDAVLVEIYDS